MSREVLMYWRAATVLMLSSTAIPMKLMYEKGPPLIINPGEAGGWLRDKCTIALLELETMAVEVIELKR